MKKFTIAALSMTMVLAGSKGAFAMKNPVPQVDITYAQTNVDAVNEYRTLTEYEREILLKAYDEIGILEEKIEKIYGEKENITKVEEEEVEKLINQIESIYDKIKPIEYKVMLEFCETSEDFKMETLEETLESALKYVDELNLSESTKVELKELYKNSFKYLEEIDKLYTDIGNKEITDEFMKKDTEISNKLDELFEKIIKLENEVQKTKGQ